MSRGDFVWLVPVQAPYVDAFTHGWLPVGRRTRRRFRQRIGTGCSQLPCAPAARTTSRTYSDSPASTPSAGHAAWLSGDHQAMQRERIKVRLFSRLNEFRDQLMRTRVLVELPDRINEAALERRLQSD